MTEHVVNKPTRLALNHMVKSITLRPDSIPEEERDTGSQTETGKEKKKEEKKRDT